MPRPGLGSQVVHPLWNANNRPAATSVLTDQCTITRPGNTAAVMDPDTGAVSAPVPAVLATGLACRVSLEGPRSRRLPQAEERVTTHTYLVQIPWDYIDLQVDDLITITASGDPLLVGRVLLVVHPDAETYQWTRLARCEHHTI